MVVQDHLIGFFKFQAKYWGLFQKLSAKEAENPEKYPFWRLFD